MEGVVKCPANYVPLTPISFLNRAAKVYRDATSVVYGSIRFTWAQTHHRCLQLASALTKLGVSRGDVIATLAPNIPAMLELHFAVPMAGAVICPLNTRQDLNMISVLLQHSESKIIFVDHQFLQLARRACNLLAEKKIKPPTLVLIPELGTPIPSYSCSDTHDYETLVASGDAEYITKRPKTEWDPISINYTSGTTSRPKGVVYNHRGVYLNAMATTSLHGMSSTSVYLWTVPMFHCNGWSLIWGLAALGGTNICLRKVSPKEIFESIVLNKVTHMGGAPTVLNMIVNASDLKPLSHKVDIMTGGSSPPPSILSKSEELGFRTLHAYGLTELNGVAMTCMWKPEWDTLPREEQYKLKARQGIHHYAIEEADVIDSATMESVPADGKSMGEVMFRGNTVMGGYLKDVKATEEALKGGWFRTGDLAVKHDDGYIEVKDRLKDIIISGGENISTIELESVLYSHPAVFEAAVVARPDDHWGETPCVFMKLKDGFELSSKEVIDFCRDHLPHYIAPRTVVFEDLPKNSTGKIQKFVLREKAKAMGSLS
nr:acyl-activating enzyme 2 [Pogostemon cablin]